MLGANQLVGTDLTQAVPLTIGRRPRRPGLRSRRVLGDGLAHHRQRARRCWSDRSCSSRAPDRYIRPAITFVIFASGLKYVGCGHDRPGLDPLYRTLGCGQRLVGLCQAMAEGRADGRPGADRAPGAITRSPRSVAVGTDPLRAITKQISLLRSRSHFSGAIGSGRGADRPTALAFTSHSGRLRCSSWVRNSWRCGGYRHIRPAALPQTSTCSEPIAGRAWFAGEHTQSNRLASADDAAFGNAGREAMSGARGRNTTPESEGLCWAGALASTSSSPGSATWTVKRGGGTSPGASASTSEVDVCSRHCHGSTQRPSRGSTSRLRSSSPMHSSKRFRSDCLRARSCR